MDQTELASSIQQLYSLRQARTSLEKQEKALLAEVKVDIDTILDASGAKDYLAGDLTVTRIAGTNVSIKSDLLLERGVAPDIIDFATNRTQYYQYKVKSAVLGEMK